MDSAYNLSEQEKHLIDYFFDNDCLKFGEYKLKTGKTSPFYINLRNLISKPDIINKISKLIYETFLESRKNITLCGLPYAGIPYSCSISTLYEIPQILLRKEKKQYGDSLGKIYEGTHKVGNKMILIDDIFTTGSSIIDSIKKFQVEGILVDEVIVIINRNEKTNYMRKLKDYGIRVNFMFDLIDIIKYLLSTNKINESEFKMVMNYLS